MKQIVVTLNGIREEEAFYRFLQGWIDPMIAERFSISISEATALRRKIYHGIRVPKPTKQQKVSR